MKLTTKLDQFDIDNRYKRNFGGVGNNHIKLVRSALENYWKFDAPQIGIIPEKTRNKEVELLYKVFKSCKVWLDTKKGKSNCKKNGDINQLLLDRRMAIANLMNEAVTVLLDRLKHHNMAVNNILRDKKDRIALTYSINKANTLNTPDHNRTQTKPLHGGYHHERNAYLSDKNASVISGSGVSAAQGYRKNYSPADNDAINQNFDIVIRKNFDHLTSDEYRLIYELGTQYDHGFNLGHVEFLKKTQRVTYQVFIDYDRTLIDDEGEIIDHKTDNMYAMDEWGNLFCKEAPKNLPEGKYFNHSSFAAGDKVICAGMLKIENGYLVMIDNLSGHYKPTRQNLKNCVSKLQEQGTDLSKAIVQSIEYTNGVQEKLYFKANDLIASINAAPFKTE